LLRFALRPIPPALLAAPATTAFVQWWTKPRPLGPIEAWPQTGIGERKQGRRADDADGLSKLTISRAVRCCGGSHPTMARDTNRFETPEVGAYSLKFLNSSALKVLASLT